VNAPIRLSGISVFLPSHNEEGNVERVVRSWVAELPRVADNYEVIVVDDGSRDRTGEIAERLAAENPHVKVVRHPVNRGYGAALRSGFAAARYPWVFLEDADNQFDPADVAALLARAADADIVAGYRKRRRDPLLRRLNAWAFFTLVTILFGRLAKDVNCAFKLMRRDLLERMALHSEGALINTEVFVLARQLHARVVEVPIQHYARTSGRQTGANLHVIVRAFSELLAFKAEMRKVEKAA
jgi:glycosyltransferase involved in cell wall biosynthesis